MIKKILVPVDGSKQSDKAIEFASHLSREGRAEVTLVHVVRPTKIPDEIVRYIETEWIKETPDMVYSRLVADKILGKASAKAEEMGIKHVDSKILHGDPAEEIISYAKLRHFDLIVLGGRGLGGSRGPMLGSVANKVCQGTNRSCVIVRKGLLDGKRILVVDDEVDVLDTLVQLLSNCKVVTASTFDDAKRLIESEHFDLAILDIMGIDGFGLLKQAKDKNVISVMLTAHALSPEYALKAYREGAASYVPKDEMANIETYLNDVLEAEEEGGHHWGRWFERFGSYFSKKFGSQ